MIRCRTPELMDEPTLDAQAHAHALRSLDRVNRLTWVDRRLYKGITALGPADGLSVLDLGTGSGGFLAYLFRRRGGGCLARQGKAGKMPAPPGHNPLTEGGTHGPLLLGLDRSAFALGQARARHDGTIRPVLADARRIPLADDAVDVVTCSLFLHHFDEPDVVLVLREAARVARRGVVVYDLSRSRLALALTWLATRVISRSRVFHTDGTKSVRAAFRSNELAELARQAGLTGARVKSSLPVGMMMIWRKPGAEHGPA